MRELAEMWTEFFNLEARGKYDHPLNRSSQIHHKTKTTSTAKGTMVEIPPRHRGSIDEENIRRNI